jgi:hypothetical protein
MASLVDIFYCVQHFHLLQFVISLLGIHQSVLTVQSVLDGLDSYRQPYDAL